MGEKRQSYKNFSQADLDYIRVKYMANVRVEEIAEAIGAHPCTITRKVGQMKKAGIIPNMRQPYRRKEKPISYTPKKKKSKALIDNETGGVKCTLCVSKKCVYGCVQSTRHMGLCNYILITGKMRGCSPAHCKKFKPITKDNPRRSWEGEENLWKN